MYFSDFELECHCKKCEGKDTQKKVSPLLVQRLDKLREMWGKPVYVSCCFRCPEHNKRVGGVENSTHARGLAADIYVDGGETEYETFYRLILASRLFDGVGHYKKGMFAHVDVRSNGTTPNMYRWEGD